MSFQAAHAEQTDLADFSLEQLLQVTVTSASKFKQRAIDAPSAVQVITRKEIRLHGWRTLGEALASLPGMFISNDRAYDYIGARGFLVPGDYNTRFLLMIDGQRNNDNVYQQAVPGSEGWVDMSAVERIEYIPGPGSAIYGSNAMFGVINVITRAAKDIDQNQVGTYVSQHGLRGVNVIARQKTEDFGLALQYSAENQNGRNTTYLDPNGYLTLADGSVSPDGVAHNMDKEFNRKVMVRADLDDLSITLSHHDHTIRPSSGVYWSVFDDPSLLISEGGTQLGLKLNHKLTSESSVFARIGYIDWYYRGSYPYFDLPAPDGMNQGYHHNLDNAFGRTVESEFRYQIDGESHHLMIGLELSRDLEARMKNSYSIDPALLGASSVNINSLVNRNSLFIQDELNITKSLLLSLGLRFDDASDSKATRSPRLGLIWQPSSEWTTKLLAGRAFRAANSYERNYADGILYLDNPNLNTEFITTMEGVVQWQQSSHSLFTASLYENKLDNIIQSIDTGAGLQYQNGQTMKIRGAELGWEYSTLSGLKLKNSISGNSSDKNIDNSPSWLAKSSVILPILEHKAFLAGEVHATSPKTAHWYGTLVSVPSQAMVNATLTFPDLFTDGMQFQLRATNLLDQNIQHLSSEDMATPTLPQPSRNILVSLDYAF